MTRSRELFLTAASAAADLLATPEVKAAWHEPSALPKLSVQALAGHLAVQVFFVTKALEAPLPAENPISVHEYYARASWIGSDPDDDFGRTIRTMGETEAADGAAALSARVAEAVRELREVLPSTPPRPVRRANWGPYSLTLDDYATTRLLEIAIHNDDLAHSVGVPTPELPIEAVETVVDLLSRIALRRHGPTKVLRALSRTERAPTSIAAL
ncbi:MAG: maleylpyruvate isomerase N-terminal domain-containing protein [Actinoallomurus sp.]